MEFCLLSIYQGQFSQAGCEDKDGSSTELTSDSSGSSWDEDADLGGGAIGKENTGKARYNLRSWKGGARCGMDLN